MKLRQRLNPLNWWREWQRINVLNVHYAQQLRTYEARIATLETQLANEQLVSEHNKAEAQQLGEAYSSLDALYNDKMELLRQALADRSNLKVELEREKAKNSKWFETFLGFSPDDFTLLNKGLWGQIIVLAPEPSVDRVCS